MLKLLLKKQLLEIFRSYYYDAKKNKARSKAATIAYMVMFALLIVVVLGGIFTLLSVKMCAPMAQAGMGWLYFALVFLMFTAESNAVNLTDGLDGLCAGCCVIALFPYVIFALMEGHQDLGILLLCVIGALMGYLKFNLHPAKVFMGDTGSLALGGLLAATAMVTKQELLLILIGGVFVIEVLSVIIQVTYYKRTKKRIFRMAPIHHHFELSGFSETQVVAAFSIITAILCLIGLMAL